MIGIVSGISGQISLVALMGVYLRWLYRSEPSYTRRDRIRDALDGKEFSRGNAVFQVKNPVFEEDNKIIYRLKKYVPVLRTIKGTTEVTLQSKEGNRTLYTDGAGREEPSEYYWTPKSLSEFLEDDCPEVNYVESFPAKEEMKIKVQIDSMDIYSIQNVLEKIPDHLQQMLEEHPSRGKNQTQQR